MEGGLQIVVPPAPPLRTETLVVRAVNGEEERRVLATPGTQRALTFLIAQCVHARGAGHPLGTDAARALATGERTRLALALACASDGLFAQQLLCPDPACRAELPLRLRFEDFRERAAPPITGTVRCPIPPDPSQPLRGYATFRLPDGADQEAVEAFSSDSRALGITGGPVLVRLLDRLLIAASRGALPNETSLWSEEDRRSAWSAIRAALGGPDSEIDVTCFTCGGAFLHRLNPLGWIRGGDPRAEEQRLADEVERIGKAYGWSEEQVLWLPRPVRRAYAAELGGR